jgi:hypothetical protein
MKVPGYIVQPFLNGVLGTAFEVASDGLKCGFNTVTNLSCDDVKAATYKSYVAELAYHLRDYGFWDDGKGVYYFASTAACQPPSTLKVDCLSKDPPATPTAPEPARIISVEAMNIVTRAYLDNHDPSLKALGDEIQANAWGQIGWPGPVTGDWRILDSYMPAGYFILNNPGTKWLGMPWGVGISSAWPAARMSAPAPTVEEVSYWPFGYPQSSKAERYPNMTATAGCSSCTAYGFEFTTTSTTPVTGFAIRQSGSAQNGRWGAFAIYNGTTGALITSCNSAFSLGAAATRLTCPATPSTSLPAGTYELVFVANSNTATISAVNSGVNLGSTIDSASVYSIAGLANLSAAPTVVWQQSMNLSSRVNTAAEPPHVLLLP